MTPTVEPRRLGARADTLRDQGDFITQPSAPFTELGISPAVGRLLADRGITVPTPIQAATIPDALAGRDVLGRGRTGSGKTLAFGLPVLTTLARRDAPTKASRPRGLILVPTRELASQVRDALAPLCDALELRQTVIHGGVGQGRQVEALRRGVDLLIACPGRLEDLIGQRLVDLDRVAVTVLDEADHMSDLGFLPAVRRLLRGTPDGSQRLLFSATLDGEVDRVVREFLHDPVTHSVDGAAAPVPEMSHHVLTVSAADRAAVIRELAGGGGRRLLFTRTKHTARRLARQLNAAGISATELHGNLSQPARDRNLASFHAGEVEVLVATDIAARGIHVDDVTLVVHVDPPADHKAYLHRSGRTARAGSAGDVVTLVTEAQRGDVEKMTRRAGIRPHVADVEPGATPLRELGGQSSGTPRPRPVTEPAPAPRTAQPDGTRNDRSRPATGGQRSQSPSGRRRRPRRRRTGAGPDASR